MICTSYAFSIAKWRENRKMHILETQEILKLGECQTWKFLEQEKNGHGAGILPNTGTAKKSC
jgi:hypothetical protein